MSKTETHKEKMERKKRERGNRSKRLLDKTSMMKEIFNSSPTMIHEDDYVPMDCVLCGTEMKSIHDTHNPFPLTDECFANDTHETGNPNRCCSECNMEKVKSARLCAMGMNPDEMEYVTKTISLGELIEMMERGEIAPVPDISKRFH